MKQFLLITIIGFVLFTTQSVQSQNIFPEGDFENGIDDWDPKFRGDAEGTFTLTDSASAANGSHAALIDVTATDALSKVKMVSPTITDGLNDLATYRYSFIAKSDVVNNQFRMKFETFDADGGNLIMSSPKDENEEYYHLTTEYKTYKFIGVNREGFNASSAFSMQCGLHIAKYYVDDIKMEAIDGIEDAGFEEGNLSYVYTPNVDTTSGADATFSIDTENANSGNNALKIDVTSSSDTASHVSILNIANFFTEKLQQYEFTFYAKSTGTGDSIFSVVNYYSGQNSFLASVGEGFELTGDYQQYRMVFTVPDSIYSVRPKLNMGKQVSTIYVDDLNIAKSQNVSVNTFNENSFNCYPNPSTGRLTIEGANLGERIELLDVTGKKVKEFKNDGNQLVINIGDLVNGIYFVKSDNYIRKIILNK